MARCRECLCDNFEGVSRLEHESKYVKVHGVIVPLPPVKDNASHLFAQQNDCVPQSCKQKQQTISYLPLGVGGIPVYSCVAVLH